MTSSTTIYIVRHGETDFNINHITQGHTDSTLTLNGVNQAGVLAKTFKDIKFDVAFASDLSRAYKTAEIILDGKDTLLNTSELLRERSYGKFDGKPSSIFIEENKDILQKLKTLHKLERRKIKFAPDIESDEEIDRLYSITLKCPI